MDAIYMQTRNGINNNRTVIFCVSYYKCLNIKCTMNLLTFAINSNGSLKNYYT